MVRAVVGLGLGTARADGRARSRNGHAVRVVAARHTRIRAADQTWTRKPCVDSATGKIRRQGGLASPLHHSGTDPSTRNIAPRLRQTIKAIPTTASQPRLKRIGRALHRHVAVQAVAWTTNTASAPHTVAHHWIQLTDSVAAAIRVSNTGQARVVGAFAAANRTGADIAAPVVNGGSKIFGERTAPRADVDGSRHVGGEALGHAQRQSAHRHRKRCPLETLAKRPRRAGPDALGIDRADLPV